MDALIDCGEQRFLPGKRSTCQVPRADQHGEDDAPKTSATQGKRLARGRQFRPCALMRPVPPPFARLVGVLQRDQHALDQPQGCQAEQQAPAESKG